MNTSVIRYRVADFLGEHPPFDSFSLEDLLAFSGNGRVMFHEDDVYLFRKGQARTPVVWVVQQGTVEIVDETEVGARLWDVLGPGDVLGLARRSEPATYPHAARTATEVILYSFDREAFDALVGRYPAAARFVTAHLSATAGRTKALRAPVNRDRLMTEREKTLWINSADPPADLASRRPVACGPNLPGREVARLMAEARSRPLAVTSPTGVPLGLISSADLCDALAAGAPVSDAPVGELMNRRFRTAPPGLRTADYLLEMVRGRCRALAVTEDGTSGSPLRAVLTDDDLAVDCGRNPALLVTETLAAETVADLAHLRARAQALLSEGLVGPSAVAWLSETLGEANDALLERVVRLAEAEMARAGQPAPGLGSCWLVFGRAGRRELLTPTAPDFGVVYADPSPEERARVDEYFAALAGLVAAKLPECGLRPPRRPIGDGLADVCGPLSAWKEFYAGLVRDPIRNAIYTAREYLDFRPACGDAALGRELHRVLCEELERSEAFIAVLANDTIAHLPPLTFFRDSIVESDGSLRATLDIEKAALDPLVDAARVFAFAGREASTANTFRRLQLAADRAPHLASVLDDAAEGLRILVYHHALAGLSGQPDEAVVHPSRLNRYEQRLLKTAFDATRRFLELAYSVYNVGESV